MNTWARCEESGWQIAYGGQSARLWTGLPNKRALVSHVEKAVVDAAKEDQGKFCKLTEDMDRTILRLSGFRKVKE